MFGQKLWALATSLTLAVVLICVLAAFAVVGALVPQGMDQEFYAKAWSPGTYQTIKGLGLLNIYRGPIFLVPALLFAVNLCCCSIKLLKRFIPEGITGRNVVSALYHLAMLAMLAGFVVTFLVSYGGDISFQPGEAKFVEFNKADSNWAKVAPRLGFTAPTNEKSKFQLRLDRFDTSYVEKGGKLYVKDWTSYISVVEDGRVVATDMAEVNHPIVHAGVKFYQASFEQKIKFTVDGEEQETEPGAPLMLGNDMMMVSSVKNGTLLGAGGPTRIGPYVELKEMPKDKWHREAKDVRPGQKLNRGEVAEVKGHKVVFASYTEGSGLSYKRDPAVKYLWITWLIFTGLIAVRIYLQESIFLWFRRAPKPA